MTEPRLKLNGGCVDFEFVGGEPVSDSGLWNAVFLSLFGSPDTWVGDVFLKDMGAKPVRSRLMATMGKPVVKKSPAAIRAMAMADLQWLIDDGIVSDIVVSVTFDNNTCNIKASIFSPNENWDMLFSFSGTTWSGTVRSIT